MSQSIFAGIASAGRLQSWESGPTLTLIDLIAPSSPPQHCRHHVAIVFQHALAAAGDDAAVTPGRVDHQRPFAQRQRFGLLAVDVFAVAACFDHHDRVPVVGRGNVHGVDVGAGQQLAKIVVGLAVVDCHNARRSSPLTAVADFFAHVAHGHVLHVFAAEVAPLIAAAHIADADPAHHDAVAGRRPLVVAQRRRGDDERHGESGAATGLQEIAARWVASLRSSAMSPLPTVGIKAGRGVVGHD